MTARFAGNKDSKELLEQSYESYPTELGRFYAPSDTEFKRDTVTLGLVRLFRMIRITADGIEKIVAD